MNKPTPAPKAAAEAGRNDPCPCGSGKKFKKCCAEKEKTPTLTFKRSAQAIELMEKARLALTSHKLDECELLAGEALKLNPIDADALHLIVNAYLERRNFAKAEELVKKCIELSSRTPAYYVTYGIIYQEQGRLDEALAMHQKALSLNVPKLLPFIYTNIGACLYHKRALKESIDYYTKAIEIDPKFAQAFFNRGSSYYALGGAHSGEMKADFDRAIELDPTNAVMLQKMSVAYHEMQDYLQAIGLLRRAISIRPDLEEAWVQLAHAYHRVGNADTALSLYEHLAEKYPDNPTVKLESAYLFPATPMSNDDITRWRERCMNHFERLMKENFTVKAPEWNVLILPFYQGYHGRNNLGLMKKMAEFFLHSCPMLHFTAPHCAAAPRKKHRIRLGLVSEWFHSNLINQFYGPLIEALTQDERFEVVLIANSGRSNEIVDRLTEAAGKYITLPTHLVPAQQAVAREELDMLIYLDIGMNVMNYLLAFARLAPIQMVMGGHPITTGIPNMDYFITSRAVEPENAAEHYSEKLFLMDKNTVVFRRKPMPADTKTREQLGLPGEETRLYACPVLLFKLHPDMDKVFASILEKDPAAVIILFESKHKMLWRSNLQKRFLLSMSPELAARIHFLPYAPNEWFYYMMRAMDCILDTFHFSFGTTAFLMLDAGVPYITLPGEFQRGRCGMLLYNQMDMPELIAKSPEHYVELALKLAQDKAFYRRMSEKIAERRDVVFDDYSVVEPFVTALKELYDSL